jgi:phosphate starvation-inducible PhoH-like protein
MSKTKDKIAKKKAKISTGQDSSPRVFQNEKIGFELNIYERNDLTEKQKELLNLIEDKDTRVVFVNGPAGTSKTFLSIYAGLKLMNKKAISDIIYVRSIAESASKSLGSLPGEANEKMEPFLMPLRDKLEELLPKSELDRLVKEERIQGIPVNYLRGASINAKLVLVDEAQNLDMKELTTALTRIGKFSKFIIIGDPTQSDINGRSGFIKMFDMFNNIRSKDEGIHCFTFTKEDIVRSGILKYIIEVIEGNSYIPPSKSEITSTKPTESVSNEPEPMFPPVKRILLNG